MQEQEQQTISALSNELEVFLRSFKDRDGNYKYFDKINNMMATSSTSITIDYIDFDSFSPLLAKDITHNPDEMLSAFNEAVISVLLEIHPDYTKIIIYACIKIWFYCRYLMARRYSFSIQCPFNI